MHNHKEKVKTHHKNDMRHFSQTIKKKNIAWEMGVRPCNIIIITQPCGKIQYKYLYGKT